MRFDYGQISQKWHFVRKIWVKSWRIAQKRKNTRHHGTYFKCYSVAYGVMSARFHTFIIRFQTSNKAHDKFVPRRDCACADHSRPSLSTALLSGWSSHLAKKVRSRQTRGARVQSASDEESDQVNDCIRGYNHYKR